MLLVIILAVGIFARTWQFGRLPPGLNPDEASTGVEAFNLLRYGTDRNGVSFPVKFISWGSGQDVLYAYLLIPLVALLGLSPSVVRLPMLLAGVLALPLLYLGTRRLFDGRIALMSTFMLAISPWHILLSRWALDSNLFPFFFLVGFVCLLYVRRSGWWYCLASLFLSLCVYAYGTAYAVIPVFIVCSLVILIRARLLALPQALAGVGIFAILSAPIAALLLINRFGWSSLALGRITVPLFPVPVRWETTTLLGAPDASSTLGSNLLTGIRLLVVESDGILYNVVEPFGYFYRVGFLLAVGGTVLVILAMRTAPRAEGLLLLAWLGSAALVASLQAVNINRFNIIFFPLLILGAYALAWLIRRHESLEPAVIFVLGVAFLAFCASYHGADYRRQAEYKFQNGILAALDFARDHSEGDLCITDKINMPYIYVLFSEPIDPEAFRSSVTYVDPAEPFRRVVSFGRYTFGVRNCESATEPTYVLQADDMPPHLGNRYVYEFFDKFVVYYPSR